MTNGLKKGFTLIELLVVIAIIAVLSSIVLASLNTSRAKGADAAVKQNLYNARSQIELTFGDSTDLASGGDLGTGLCTDTKIVSMLNAASQAVAGNITSDRCNRTSAPTPPAWAISSILKSGQYWCIDSAGKVKEITLAQAGGLSCP